MTLETRDDRQMRALTGVPAEKYSTLEAAYGSGYEILVFDRKGK